MAERLGAIAGWAVADAVAGSVRQEPSDTSIAEVTKANGGDVWVRLAGAKTDTPVRRVLQSVSVGDTVRVTISGGRATIIGNSTSPAVGSEVVDATVAPVSKQAEKNRQMALEAKIAANSAVSDAGIARAAASSAQADAQIARDSADSAVADAATAKASAQVAQDAAGVARQEAEAASASAAQANTAANDALAQLGVVQDVTGTLAWVTEHGTYALTQDATVQDGKAYFVRTGSEPYTYVLVSDPKDADIGTYYELSIDEALSQYVSSHLALTDAGLYVTKDASGYRVLLANDGMSVVDPQGHTVAKYGTGTTFASDRDWYVGSANAFVFYDASEGTLQIGGSDVTIGGKAPADLLTSLDVSVTQTATGADITVNGDTVSIANGEQGPRGIQGETGATGPQGPKGDTGTGIASTTVTYGTSASASAQPTSWSDAAPTSLPEGTWLWTRTVTAYSDGTDTTAYSKSYVGTSGQPGTTYYTHIRYSESADGTGHVASPTASTVYIGTYTGTSSTAPSSKTSYKWSRYVGQDGTDGHSPEITTSHSGTTTTIYADGTSIGTVEDGADGSTPSITASKSGGTTTVKVDGVTVATIVDGTSVTVSKVEYGTSTSASTSPSSWSTTVPTSIAKGRWLWVKTTYSDSKTTTTKSYVGTDGEDGTSVYVKSSTKSGDVTTVVLTDGTTDTTLTISDGEDGASGTPGANGYVHTAWANSADGTTDFSTTASAGKQYLGVYTDNTQADSTSPSAYSWSLIKGDKGDTGTGVSSITEYYALNNSTTAPSDGSFSTGVKTPTASNRYVWNYELITYTDSSTAKTPKHIAATYGETGSAGKGIASITDYYAVNNSTTAPADSAFSTTVGTPTATNRYLWNYELTTYTDGNTSKTGKRVIGVYGEKGADGHSPTVTATKSGGTTTIKVDGTTIATVDDGEDGTTPTVTTRKNSDGSTTVVINGSDSATIENGTDGTSYYTYVRYSANANGSGMVASPTSATKYIGVYSGTSASVPAYTSFKWSKYVGEDGNDAAPLTVTATATDYQLSTSGTTAPTGTWSATPLAPTTTQYLWTRTTLTFSDGTTATSYSVGGLAGAKGDKGDQGDTGPEGIVSVTPDAIDWEASTATLRATLWVNGEDVQPNAWSWTKNLDSTVLGTGQTLEVTDLDATYRCTVTW